jgi:hypothetical protein
VVEVANGVAREHVVITPLEAVQPYRDAGIVVLPAVYQKKNPTVGWTEFQTRQPTDDEYQQWFGSPKLSNYWALCGKVSRMVGLDADSKTAIEWAYEHYGKEVLDATTCVKTSRGLHWWFRLAEDEEVESWKDDAIGIELHGERSGLIAPPSIHATGIVYRFVRGLECLQPLPAALRRSPAAAKPSEANPGENGKPDGLAALLALPASEGGRNNWLVSVCGHLAKIHPFEDGYLASVELANAKLTPPLPEAEWRKLAASIWRAEQARNDLDVTRSHEPPKPTPLGAAAFHGPLGAFVRLWEPLTEADPAAMLLTALTGFASLIGDGPHHTVGADVHKARLYVCVVGATATARKGMSSGPPLALLAAVDPVWEKRCVLRALSTGEGLIHRLRDPVSRLEPSKKNGQILEEVVTDPGIKDKRLFVKVGEFARILAVMTRDGNTLSQIVRELWDSGNADNPTKYESETVHGAHVCQVAHITLEELRRALTDVDAASGFANRYLWVYAERHGSHPLPEQPDPQALAAIVEQLTLTASRLCNGEFSGETLWSDDAKALWIERYDDLNRCGGGLSGACVARGPAQVLRLALVYALADCSQEIGRIHLEAALEVWRYCAQSARYIFGDRTGNETADRILAELRERGSMTRLQIRELFQRNKSSAEIGAALTVLEQAGAAQRTTRHQQGEAGRPAEVWTAC